MMPNNNISSYKQNKKVGTRNMEKKIAVLTPGKLKNGEQQIYFHLNIKKGKRKSNQYFFPLNKSEMTKKIF